VQKASNQVLINVQLIDTRTDSHIWAQSYQRGLDNIFGVEGDVAQQIAVALKARLSPAETTRLASDMSTNQDANNLLLQAEYEANRGNTNYDTASMKAAIPLYKQAIAKAPDFALAYAGLSYVQSQLAWFAGGGMDVPQLIVDARNNAEKASKLAPDLPVVRLALGYSDYYGRGDYDAALKAFAAALALRPNDARTLAAQGYVQRRQGHFNVAIASLQKAVELDPRNSALVSELGQTQMMLGQYAEAKRVLQRALALDPHNVNARGFLSLAILYADGDIPNALIAAQGDAPPLKQQRSLFLTYQRKYLEALELLDGIPDTPDNFGPGGGAGPKAVGLAELYRQMGDSAHARPLYEQALPPIRARIAQLHGANRAFEWNELAAVELGLGHTAEALDAIAKSLAIIDGIQDEVYGPESRVADATLYAEARRPDLAVPLLGRVFADAGLGAYYAPVMLWLDPAWDPIRSDPRFQALLKQYAQYKPAVTYDAAVSASAASPAEPASAPSVAKH
jgi:tetratricopeptide (TPR) repeat protein